MGPPHKKVREDSNPYNRGQEGDHKEFSGFLEGKSNNIVLEFLRYSLRELISEMCVGLPGYGHLEE